ncbi:HprK-like kinase/phosphatase [Methanonatronarchaeum thermophilum]|uniref:HprK-like kinase/phosphatase n=1 Tax=Methanonatronarchaeum thermophilum TaxID=1927129 RepID=A0A1Y3G9H5_9EURY|nr:hypothetical protein [Methanonatronarchaeum thermophilum]OUJ18088.1 HprK-like kinase/phosphatase [Methanonatronarchaeum thermophilum]
MASINLYDKVQINLIGNSNSIINLKKYFSYFEGESESPDFKIDIKPIESLPKIEKNLGSTFAVAGEYVVIKENQRSPILLNRDLNEILISPDTSHTYLSKFIEYPLRKSLIKDDLAMIHAASVKIKGETLCFPAWRNTGKTNTLLSLLKKDAKLISDDRVWIDSKGNIMAYPLAIHMGEYNYEAFPELKDNNYLRKKQKQLGKKIKNVCSENGNLQEKGFFKKALWFTSDFYLDTSHKKIYSLKDLPINLNVEYSSKIDKVILLQSNVDIEPNEMEKTPAKPKNILKAIEAINEYEWNNSIRTYIKVIDYFFPNKNLQDEFSIIEKRENEIFSNMLETINLFELNLPEKSFWAQNNSKMLIYEAIK